MPFARYQQALRRQRLRRDPLLMKLGAVKHEAGRAANPIKVEIPKDSAGTASFESSTTSR